MTDTNTASQLHSDSPTEEFDLFVIGGGPGGLAACHEAVRYGIKVGLANYVEPSIHGSKWSIGGASVNVGSLPAKLMHFAGIFGDNHEKQYLSGWNTQHVLENNPRSFNTIHVHDWEQLLITIQSHIKRTNFQEKVSLREKKIKYLNYFGKIVDRNTVKLENKNGEILYVKAKIIVIAVGCRPKSIPSSIAGYNLAISSDDLFSLEQKPPGKTLIIGGSCVALEFAGFLNSLGYDVTVLHRSLLLRDFDQDVVGKLQVYMAFHGIKFIQGEIISITEVEQVNTTIKKKQVKFIKAGTQPAEGKEEGKQELNIFASERNIIHTDEIICDTVIAAIGRKPATDRLGLENVGIKVSPSGKILTDLLNKTNVDNIYAIGDATEGSGGLASLASRSGQQLARRLFSKEYQDNMNQKVIPRVIYTPLEYSFIGLSEAEGISQNGKENVQSYVAIFKPIEWVLSQKDYTSRGYCKLVVLKTENERVIGLHYLGPHAAEVIQGFVIAMELGAKKSDFDRAIPVHLASAGEFLMLKQVKGVSEEKEWTCCG